MNKYTVSICLLLLLYSNCTSPIPVNKRLNLIIDADTANEVDDLYAIVRAIAEPTIHLRGITSAQFHTSPLASDTSVLESQAMNHDIIRLMNRPDIPLPIGSNKAMASANQAAHSQASQFIIDQAHKLDEKETLYIAILGSCTNVASAIIQDPSIIPKLSIHYIGFWHDVETNTYDKKEFNSGNDTIAVNVLLDTEGLDFNVMTATTCQHLVFDKTDVDQQLSNKNDLSTYMINRWETFDRWWTTEDPQKEHWIMWDLAIIEALIHPHLAVKETFTTPPENTKRYIKAYTSIQVEAMIKDFWKTMSSIHLELE